jgi:3-methyl-2-oxobutanoate hydroxymethyltransferase
VREYAQMGSGIDDAVKRYASDVRNRSFPGAENVYRMKKTG